MLATTADTATQGVPATTEDPAVDSPRGSRGLARPLVLLPIILIVGLLLRALGVMWGLPFQLHPDEWVIFDGAIDMAKRNSFEPQLFLRPDHVEIKLSYLAYVAYGVVQGAPVDVLAAADMTPFIAISRSITVAIGVATIALAYIVGRRFSPAAGLVAAVLFALFPPFIEHSHYATPDVPLTFAVLVVAWGGMRYLASPTWVNLLIMSAGVAVSVGIKYPGAIGASMIAIVVIIAAARSRRWIQILTRGAGSIGAVIGFLFLISPVLFSNVYGVFTAIKQESRTTHVGADGLGWWGNLRYYVETFAASGGLVLILFGVIGAVWAVRRRRLDTVPLAIGAIYWVALSAVPLHWARWALPMYISALMFSAIGIVVTARYLWARRGATTTVLRAIFVVLVGVSALNLVIGAAVWTVRYATSDTRVIAKSLFERYGVTDQNTIAEGYTPLSPGAPRAIFDDFSIVDGTLTLSDTVVDADSKLYVMISAGMYKRYLGDEQYADEQEFYRLLEEQFPVVDAVDPGPVVSFSEFELVNIVHGLQYLVGAGSNGPPGPRIVLYEIPPSAE